MEIAISHYVYCSAKPTHFFRSTAKATKPTRAKITNIEATYTSPRARGGLFVLKGPYDLRVPPIVKFSQESESVRLTKIILSKSTVKTL